MEAKANRMKAESEGNVGDNRRSRGNADCWRVGIAGLTPGVGVSLVTTCMAGYFSSLDTVGSVAVAELGTGGLYDSLGMDKRFSLREFHSFYKASSGTANMRSLKNVELNVNWALKMPTEHHEKIGYREALRLIYGIFGDVALFDFSGREDEEGWLLLREMDVVVAVIDPMPDRLLAGRGTLERWKLSALPIRCLVNKNNRGVNWRELSRFLKLKDVERLSYLEPELLYASQYSGNSPWEEEVVQQSWKPVFSRLFSDII